MSGEESEGSERALTRREALQGGSLVVASGVGLETLTSNVMAQSGGPTNEISGVVEDDNGPVQNATVAAVPHDESLAILETTTAADGTYTFTESALHSGENLYHVIARDGTETDPRRGVQNYPFIAADGGAAAPSSGVARYEFEQDVTDSWGDNDATDNTSAGYTTDAAVGSYAKSFDGTDDHVACSSSVIDSTVAHSVTFWVYFDNLTFSRQINTNDNDNGLRVGINGSDNFYYELEDSGSIDGTTISSSPATGQWLFVACTFDGSTMVAYLDGSQQDSQSSSGSGSDPFDLTIGAYEGGSDVTDGNIDDVRIYDKALSSTEVSNLYNNGSIDG